MTISEPSERDLAIFHAVHLEGAPPMTVAATLQLPQAEVIAILQRVKAWYEATTPQWAETANLSPLVAARLHQERLNYLYSEAMGAWQDSKRPIVVTRQTPAALVTTTVPSFGQTRYLAAAARIAVVQADATIRLAKRLQKLNAPPKEVCTREAVDEQQDGAEADEPVDTTASEETTCNAAAKPGLHSEQAPADFLTPARAVDRQRVVMRSA